MGDIRPANLYTRRAALALATAAMPACSQSRKTIQPGAGHMELGAFSISLAVKDLAASRQFYEKFGFNAFAGDASKNFLILKNGDYVIGLFQGMFDKNILTFNPGWDSNAQAGCFHGRARTTAPAEGARREVGARGRREHDGPR